MFAYDVYGSAEMKFIVMMMNNIIDPKEFDFNKVRLIRPSDLSVILNRMEAVNEEYMGNNRAKLKSDFKSSEGNIIWSK